MQALSIQLQNSVLRGVLKRLHYPLEVMLVCVRWYAAYPLSLRNLEEMMAERGVAVDHATVHRWALKILPVLAGVFRRRKRAVGASWRMDETYILVGGQWKYLYRAVDRTGQTVDFLLTARRDEAAARRFFEQAINLHDVPEKITIDKSGANTAAVRGLMADSGLVRAGADKASVTASFEFGQLPPGIRALLDDADIEVEPGEQLILKRQLRADGDAALAGAGIVAMRPWSHAWLWRTLSQLPWTAWVAEAASLRSAPPPPP